ASAARPKESRSPRRACARPRTPLPSASSARSSPTAKFSRRFVRVELPFEHAARKLIQPGPAARLAHLHTQVGQRDLADLARDATLAARAQLTRRLEMLAMPLDRGPQSVDAG